MLETWARPTCVLGEGVVMSRCPQRQVVLASVAVRRDWLGHVRGQQLQGEQAALGFADLAEACLAESLAVDDARALRAADVGPHMASVDESHHAERRRFTDHGAGRRDRLADQLTREPRTLVAEDA